MSKRAAPRLATWLIGRLGRDAKTDSLIGDLSELFAEGRSAMWYWQQALVAIVIRLATAAYEHGLSFISAVAIAYAVVHFSAIPGQLIWREFVRTTGADYQWPTIWALLPLNVFLILFHAALQLLSGWLVVRVYRSYPRVALVALASLLALTGLWMAIRDARGWALLWLPSNYPPLRQQSDVLLLFFQRTALPIAFALTGGLLALRRTSGVPLNGKSDWLLASLVALTLVVEAVAQSLPPSNLVLIIFTEPLWWIAQLAALSCLVQRAWRPLTYVQSHHGTSD